MTSICEAVCKTQKKLPKKNAQLLIILFKILQFSVVRSLILPGDISITANTNFKQQSTHDRNTNRRIHVIYLHIALSR